MQFLLLTIISEKHFYVHLITKNIDTKGSFIIHLFSCQCLTVWCFILQSLNVFRAPTRVIRAVRIRSCFFTQNFCPLGRTLVLWLGPRQRMAYRVPREWDGTALSGGLLLRISCTGLMIDRRTPAKRREKHWWKNVTGTFKELLIKKYSC